MKQHGRKTGRLSDGAKVPDKGLGLDWDAIRREREQRLEAEIARGVDNAETREHLRLKSMDEAERRADMLKKQEASLKRPTPKAKPAGPGRGKGSGRRGPKYDVHEMVRRYTELDQPPKVIAAEMGASYYTVVDWLKKQTDDQGRPIFDPKKFRTGGPKGQPLVGPGKARNRYCGVCGTDLDADGNAIEKTQMRNGKRVKGGRECVPCKRRRGRENWAKRK